MHVYHHAGIALHHAGIALPVCCVCKCVCLWAPLHYTHHSLQLPLPCHEVALHLQQLVHLLSCVPVVSLKPCLQPTCQRTPSQVLQQGSRSSSST